MSRILLVDPSASARVPVVKKLEQSGHRVEEILNGREALDVCLNAPPDCMVMELVLQELDGFKLLKSLKENRVTVPVLVTTELRMQGLEQRCFDLGACAFVRKPVVPLRLSEIVNELIAGEREKFRPKKVGQADTGGVEREGISGNVDGRDC